MTLLLAPATTDDTSPRSIVRSDPPRRSPLVATPRREKWPWVLASAALVVYVAGAVWILYGLHYEIGDALARSADARYMLFSRDPHLAAVGFVWLPLPVIVQLPFMLVLSPLGHAALAGPLATAVAGALTTVVVAKITRAMGLSFRVSLSFAVLYSFNPVVAFTAANGMSESWFYLSSAIAVLGLVRWARSRRSLDLALLAAGLAGAMTVRYETLAFVPVLAAAAALYVPGLRRRLTTAFTVAAPAAYLFVLWLLAEYIIERDPFFWLHVQSTVGRTPAHAVWLPPAITLLSSTQYATKLTLELVPGILLIGPLLVARGKGMGLRLGLVASALLLPALVVYQLLARITWADPRYFEPSILFVSLGGALVASTLRERTIVVRALGTGALLLVLGLGWITGTVALSNPRATNIEQEHTVFRRLMGRGASASGNSFAPVIPEWKRLAADLDKELSQAPGRHQAILDASVAFPAFVFTKYPNRIIVSSDRDFLQVVSSPEGHFDFLILTSSGPEAVTFRSIVADSDGGAWKQIGDYSVAELYHWVPAPPAGVGGGTAAGPRGAGA